MKVPPARLGPRGGADAHNATAILLIVAALTALGVVLVYSSTSAGVALHKYQDVTRFLRKQILWVTLGLGAFVLARTTPLAVLRRWSPMALLASVVVSLMAGLHQA